MNRADLVDRLIGRIAGDGPRFLPLLGEFLAYLPQKTVAETFSDPGVLFSSLRDARQLLDLGAHLVYLHPALLDEAAGLSGSWGDPTPPPPALPLMNPRALPSLDVAPAVVEAFRRLSLTDHALPRGLILPGPAALGQRLLGGPALDQSSVGDEAQEDAFDLLTSMLLRGVRACGEIGLDLLFVCDDRLLSVAITAPDLLDLIWSPISNLASFYESRVVLVSRSLTDLDQTASALSVIGPAAFVSDTSPGHFGRELPCPLALGLDADQISDRGRTGLASLATSWHQFPLISSVVPLTTAVSPEDLLAIRRMVESQFRDPNTRSEAG